MNRPGVLIRAAARFAFFTVVFLIPIAATVLAAAWAGGPTYP